jgi:valyl-tRNA synthetase
VTLAHTIETALRAFHPYIPYLTEELWQRVPKPATRPKSVALAPYPTRADGRPDEVAELEMASIQRLITAARTVRSEHEVHPSAKVPLIVRSAVASRRDLVTAESRFIATLVRTEGDPIVESSGDRPPGYVLTVAGDTDVLVGLRGLVEAKKERERIERTITKIQKDLAGLEKRLGDDKFLKNAPPDVVEQAGEQKAALERQRARLVEERGLADEL